MGKFWKKNKAVISGVLLAAIGITTFVSLGYLYSGSTIGYDYVGVGAQVDSINYNTGTGNMYRITTMLNEGLLTPTTKFDTLQTSITIALTEETTDLDGNTHNSLQNELTDNGLVSIEEYAIASKYVLVKYALDYEANYHNNDEEDDPDNPRGIYGTLNDNEKTLVILASDAVNGEEVDLESENLDRASRILAHARPVTYIGDDVQVTSTDKEGTEITVSESIDVPEWYQNSPYMVSAYAFGVADAIYTNPDFTTFRFRLRDGSLNDGVSTWQTWYDGNDKRIDRVSAADIAFGMSRQVPAMYGSSSRYMYTSIARLKGSNEAASADKVLGMSDVRRYTVDGVNLDNKLVDEWTDTDAIYYALPSDGVWEGYSREGTIAKDEEITTTMEESTKFPGEQQLAPRESGIIFHDPKGMEDSENPDSYNLVEGTDVSDYSYIDFNVMDGADTFPTMMASTGFWPINWEWFIKTIGRPGFDEINEFGTSAETILSNGSQQVTEFDNLYGYTTKRNENYYDHDLVTVEKGSYRMITEASTQVAMFENGAATYITGADSNSKAIKDSDVASAWLPSKFTKPATKFMFFNLGTDRLEKRAEVAPFTSDPNFRRAFGYAFNTNVYHELNSIDTAYAVSTFEPAGMYTDASGNDLVDYMTDTTFTNQGTDLGEDTPDSTQLEYFDYDARLDAVENPIDLSQPDPRQNYDLADYYFQVFLDDMNELGITVPKEIKLKYLTSVGPNDPFIKTIQQQVSTHEFPGGYRIIIDTDQVSSGSFWGEYYAADYDLASIQWSADYLDAWSNIGIFNLSENSRGGNSTGGWNLWDGSDYTFNDETYGSAENAEKARELFNDGFAQFYEESTYGPNITSVEFAAGQNGVKYGGTTVFDTYTSADFMAVADQLWNAVLSDNGITSWNGEALANTDGDDPETETIDESTSGLNYNAHTSDIWSDEQLKLASNILFELILKDGGTAVIGTTESGSISPTRALLEGDPVVGYEARTFSFDLTKSKGFWDSVDKELRDEFFKK